tara:strand:- start:33 stop:185 length:153 start_codon:yes stop_codon:yes gene_type:complete
MDFLFGFTLGYFCKEIFSYLKKLSNNNWNNKTTYTEDWDWLSSIEPEDLP